MPQPQQSGQKAGDGKVESYQRVVNGKIVNVGGYDKKSTTSTRAAQTVRRQPGRPRISANPGTYTGGRDIPGVRSRPVATPPPLALQKQPDQQDQQKENPDEADR